MSVEIELNGEVKFGLMKEDDVRDKLVSPTTTIYCWSMCKIVVNNINSILSLVHVTTESHEMRMRASLISANVFVVQSRKLFVFGKNIF